MREKGIGLALLSVCFVGLIVALGWVEAGRQADSEVGFSPLNNRSVVDALVPITSQGAHGAAALATFTCDVIGTLDCTTGCELVWPTEEGKPTCDTCDEAALDCHPPDEPGTAWDTGVLYTLIAAATCGGHTCEITCYHPTFFCELTVDGPTCAGSTCEGETCSLAKCDVYDYGDAPEMSEVVAGAQYETTNDAGGARHMIDGVFYLGAKEDAEVDGRPTDLADGDDAEAFQIGDDEDGVWFPTTFNPGRKATVIVSASLPGTLFAWVDYDLTGGWREETDSAFPDGVELLSAYNWVVIDVPETAVASPASYARFRFADSGKLAQSGTAENGEVEDYRVPILNSLRAWVIVDRLLYAPGDSVAVGFYVSETAQVTLICHRTDGMQTFLSTTTAEAGRHTFPEQGGGVTAELPAGTATIEMIATSLLSGATVWLTTPYVVTP